MYDFVTIGDAVKDLFIKPHDLDTVKNHRKDVDICFPHGSKISIDEVYHDIGGSACNVSVGMSKLGLKTAIISSIGNDREGEEIKDKLIKEEVDLKYLKINKNICTNFSVILVYDGQRTVLVYRGLKDYSEIKIPKNLHTRWIYLGPVAESFCKNYKDIVALASEKNVKIAINPGHRQIVDGRDELKKVLYISNVLILNMEEAQDLVKVGSFAPKELLKKLKSFGPRVVIITDGPNGAYATCEDRFYHVKPYATEALDPTGAGDAFSTGFLSYYSKNEDVTEALKAGIMLSSEVILKYGAQTNLIDSRALDELISKSPDITEF